MLAVRRQLGRLGFALAGWVAVAGCHTEASSPVLAPIARGDFADKLAAAVCDAIAPCCAAVGNAYDAASCRGGVAANLLAIHPEYGATTVDADYDAAAAARCLDTVARATRACRQMTRKESEACEALFIGHHAPGAECAYDAECAAPHGGAASCEATVQPPTRLSCVQFTGVQTEGEACDGNAVDSPDGINFSGSLYCPAWNGLRCDFDRGVCASLPRLGERCTSDPAAVWFAVCADGAYCDPITEVCVAQSATGPCLVTVDNMPVMTHACAAGTYCDTNDGAHVYPCRPELPDGERCGLYASCAAHVCNSEQRCGIATASACQGNLNLF